MTIQTLAGVATPATEKIFSTQPNLNTVISAATAGQNAVAYPTDRLPKTKNIVVFKGTIEIMQVANGFVMNIATKEGYAYDTYIASTIQEVNERLTATMVTFKLEQP
jgi:hypothetical protein